jgi:hypothetical protein
MPGLPRKSTKNQFTKLLKKSGKSKTNTEAGATAVTKNISTVERKILKYQQFINENMNNNFTVGDTVYFLNLYGLLKGTIKSIGKKIKVEYNSYPESKTKYLDFDKVAKPDDMICVVWQQWKGADAFGGSYRIEKDLYKNRQLKAKDWPRDALVWETSYGIEYKNLDGSTYVDPRLLPTPPITYL